MVSLFRFGCFFVPGYPVGHLASGSAKLKRIGGTQDSVDMATSISFRLSMMSWAGTTTPEEAQDDFSSTMFLM